MRRIVVTGGCGFIGSHVVRHLLSAHPGAQVVNLDALTYAANPDNLADCATDARYRLEVGDVADPAVWDRVLADGGDAVVHLAAESHVDRSILDPGPFLRTNVAGVETVLRAVRRHKIPRLVHVSTDEVYGSLEAPLRATEAFPLRPGNPYSASKAAGDHLCLAHANTYGTPVVLTRGSNTYGPYQHPEKFLPLFLTNAEAGQPLPLYGDGGNVRDWLHVTDHAAGIAAALAKGRPGEVYNLGGGNEHPNLEVARELCRLAGKPESLIRFVPDRPGHDRRYALDTTKARAELGFAPREAFAQGLAETAAWYRAHRAWWERAKSGAWRAYYAQQYGGRLAAGTPG